MFIISIAENFYYSNIYNCHHHWMEKW